MWKRGRKEHSFDLFIDVQQSRDYSLLCFLFPRRRTSEGVETRESTAHDQIQNIKCAILGLLRASRRNLIYSSSVRKISSSAESINNVPNEEK
jgi:hypothetical protein